MSERLTPIPFDKLIRWMTEEYKSKNSVFGVSREHFYKNTSKAKFEIFGRPLGSPLGAAAGPHTQLAQNLVSGYVAGLRFMELKTVQIIDGEDMRKCIARPCINAEDEGYNCEWSTELTVEEAYAEYVKGWFALHIAAKEFGISDVPDFVFNMSVGYDYEGITSPKIDGFINGMSNAQNTPVWKECREYLLSNLHLFSVVDAEYIEAISGCISSSITLSTLHGCPPEEIEKIANHFLSVKKLHTYIKCNPTLLGYDFVRALLDRMGYGYVSFDHRHFDADLKYEDAVLLIGRLRSRANRENLSFGVKLTNTFPVQAKNGELPAEFMYMSGRALFPLSIHVAKRLSNEFDGSLPISFSGGADFFNADRIGKVGIAPVTVATTILKPGGYARAKQMSEKVEGILNGPFHGIDLTALDALADGVESDSHHVKWAREGKSRKMGESLPIYDCFTSPCSEGGCPIHQQIPAYLALVAEGEYDRAFSVIAIDNPLPAVTSEICNHACQTKCTRMDYDRPIEIRSAKNTAVMHAQKEFISRLSPAPLRSDKKVVVVGAGPAGIAAALYLRRNGVDVTVLEKRDKPMGVVQYLIPGFRVSDEAISMDYQMAVKTGVQFRFGVDAEVNISQLRETYDFVVIATGAWGKGDCPLKEGGEKLIDALAFLEQSKSACCQMNLGKRVAVIGGGDVAMDCARAAKRAPGVENVSIVYRRTKEWMPAQKEELTMALADGVAFLELLAPVSYSNGILTAERMELKEKGSDGRRKVASTGETVEIPFDTVISAVGAQVETELFRKNLIAMDKNGYAALNACNCTNLDGVYIAGDCRRGAATIVQAASDSKAIAMDILKKLGLLSDFKKVPVPVDKAVIACRKAMLCEGESNPMRCLSCGQVCEICVEVCPNRANISLMVDGKPQIIHIDGMCNECGNCGIFCPYKGNPYLDKITLFWTREAFDESENSGILFLYQNTLLVRDENGYEFVCDAEDGRLSPELAAIICVLRDEFGYPVI